MSDQHRPCGMSAFAPSGNCWRPSQWNALFSTKTLVGEDFQTTSTQHSPSLSPVPCRFNICWRPRCLKYVRCSRRPARPGIHARCGTRATCSLCYCMQAPPMLAFQMHDYLRSLVGRIQLGLLSLLSLGQTFQPLMCFERLPFSIVYLS